MLRRCPTPLGRGWYNTPEALWPSREPTPAALTAATTVVLHLALANLRPGLSEPEAEAIVDAFGRLASLPGVLRLGAVRARSDDSTHSLALFVYLRDAAGLEAFGTDGRHIDFLRRSLVGAVTDLATADVATSVLPPETYSGAACFGARLRPQTFDWQVRGLLERLNGPLVVSGGLALNDRQRFRAAGLAFWTGGGEPDAAFGEFRRRWAEAWGPILTEAALVLGDARPLGAPAPRQETVP